jgi:hypothetical protein
MRHDRWEVICNKFLGNLGHPLWNSLKFNKFFEVEMFSNYFRSSLHLRLSLCPHGLPVEMSLSLIVKTSQPRYFRHLTTQFLGGSRQSHVVHQTWKPLRWPFQQVDFYLNPSAHWRVMHLVTFQIVNFLNFLWACWTGHLRGFQN